MQILTRSSIDIYFEVDDLQTVEKISGVLTGMLERVAPQMTAHIQTSMGLTVVGNVEAVVETFAVEEDDEEQGGGAGISAGTNGTG